MKKTIALISILLLLVFTAGLCGCGSSGDSSGDASGSNASSASEDTAISGEDAEGTSEADEYYARLLHCKEQIEEVTDFKPQIVIVLGSGLGDYVEKVDVVETIPYKDIDGWPNSTVKSHAGNLVFAKYKGLNLAIMQGRVHYYEGYTMPEVVLPLRVLHLMGADTCILTNAAGAINPEYRVGDFVCIEDQITSFVPSPLIGENIDELGERFVGMTDAYDKEMREAVLEIGRENNIPVHSGVYLQVTGPQFETPTEIEMYRDLGADTVAMSLGVETIAAVHMGMKVCGIDCVSNMAAGMEEEGFSHESISDTMEESSANFEVLINGLLDRLAEK